MTYYTLNGIMTNVDSIECAKYLHKMYIILEKRFKKQKIVVSVEQYAMVNSGL